jgi:hypothetical protein
MHMISESRHAELLRCEKALIELQEQVARDFGEPT